MEYPLGPEHAATISTWLELPWQGWFTLLVVIGTLVLLVREVASPDLIMLGSLASLIVAGVFDRPESAFVGFSSHSVLTIGALFVVAGAARKTGALTFLYRLMQPRSRAVGPALARLMLPVSFLSAFMNNTPLVALLVPAVQQWGRRTGIPASKLLIPLSYAAVLGGMATLIGTSTNIVVSAALEEATGRGLGMFELTRVGVPAALAGMAYLALVGHRLLPAQADQTRLTPFDIRSYQFELRVPEGSDLAGKTVEQAGLRHLEGAYLAHVFRRRDLIAPVRPDLLLEAGDLLAFSGSTEVMERLLRMDGLERVVEPIEGAGEASQLPLFEAVVAAGSSLVGSTLRDAKFRGRFHAVVLGVHRKGKRVLGPLGRSPLQTGDLLLLESRDDFADKWLGSDEFYLVAPLERGEGVQSRRATWVLLVMGALIVTVSMGWLPVVTAALLAALLVVFAAGMSPTEARQALDLSVLLVIAAAFGIGGAIEQTGLAQVIGKDIVAVASVLGPLGVLAGVYLATNLLTEVLTNNVAAVMVFPIGLAAAREAHLDPRGFAVAIAIAASAAFASPIGYQTNLMVMGPGGYRFVDYLRVGAPLNLLIMLLTLCIVWWLWL